MTTVKLTKMHKRLNTPSEERKPLGKEISKNNFWDKLNDLYQTTLKGSTRYGHEVYLVISPIVENADKKKLIKDPINFSNLTNLVTRDISQFQDKIKLINDSHKQFTGGTTEADEHMQMLKLHSDYTEAWELFNSNIEATIKELSEIVTDVEQTYLDNKKQISDMIDPNVISDISFKEVVNEPR